MSNDNDSIWNRPLTPASKDKKLLRATEWFALIMGIAGTIAFPVLFFLSYSQRSPDYSLLIWCPICAAFAWQMKKKIRPISERSAAP